MPYNTRRKSLSLPSLGIHLPGHHASRAAHRSPPSSSSASTTPRESPPAKRVKRSHTLGSTSSPISKTLVSRPRNSVGPVSVAAARPRPLSAAGQATPPPSPGEHHHITKLDFDGINDDIVVGVLQQLQSTGNRPHLIKELAAVLITSLSSVESSSNPTAIISSRLTNYLRRPWTALAPCPLAKEQVAVHPRRVYYYLTTCPRQEIPEFAEPPRSGKRIISPSISSGPDEEEESDQSFLKARSPSPDLDLSSVHLDFDTTMNVPSLHFHPDSFQSTPTHPPTVSNISDNRRAASPPLEHDEREFTQTASTMLERRQTEQERPPVDSTTQPSQPFETPITTLSAEIEEDPTSEHAAQRNREAAAALFGPSHHLQLVDHSSPSLLHPFNLAGMGIDGLSGLNSPMLRPELHCITNTPRKAFSAMDIDGPAAWMDFKSQDWADLKSPECVDLSELDDLLGGF